ncbi:hypothetical protein BV20DRAFT_288790 [Pilatotrama ljubarskyi]|nr:hypothetical protein BV20DRAFT_288790 [Pilatotrama ljubarskyi]
MLDLSRMLPIQGPLAGVLKQRVSMLVWCFATPPRERSHSQPFAVMWNASEPRQKVRIDGIQRTAPREPTHGAFGDATEARGIPRMQRRQRKEHSEGACVRDCFCSDDSTAAQSAECARLEPEHGADGSTSPLDKAKEDPRGRLCTHLHAIRSPRLRGSHIPQPTGD